MGLPVAFHGKSRSPSPDEEQRKECPGDRQEPQGLNAEALLHLSPVHITDQGRSLGHQRAYGHH